MIRCRHCGASVVLHFGAPLRLAAHRHAPDLLPVRARRARLVVLQLHHRHLQPGFVQSGHCAGFLPVLHVQVLQGVRAERVDLPWWGVALHHRFTHFLRTLVSLVRWILVAKSMCLQLQKDFHDFFYDLFTLLCLRYPNQRQPQQERMNHLFVFHEGCYWQRQSMRIC